MAITLASHGGGFVNSGNPSPTVTIPVTCSAGDVIYLLTSSSTITLTGETFSLVTSGFPLYRCVAASAHSGSSLVVTGGAFAPLSAIMQAWTGVDNTHNTFGSIGSSMGTTASASVTTAVANSLVALFVDCPNSSVTIAAGSGYTISDVDGPSSWTYGGEYANSTTASSGTVVTPTATLGSSVVWSALAISLAPSSGGGGSSGRRRSSACIILP